MENVSSSLNRTAVWVLPGCHMELCDGASGVVFYLTVSLLDIAIGLPTNAWVLRLIGRCPGSLDKSELVTLNLAIMEVVYCLILPLSFLNFYVLQSSALFTALCFMYGLILTGRPLFQCCMCLERYLAVVHPLTFLRYRPLRYRVGSLVVVWALVLGYGGINLMWQEIYIIGPVFMVVLVIDSYCSLSILRVLRQPGPGSGPGNGAGRGAGPGNGAGAGAGAGPGKGPGNEAEPGLGPGAGPGAGKGAGLVVGAVLGKGVGLRDRKRRALWTVLIILAVTAFNYLPLIVAMPFSKQLPVWEYCCQLAPITITLSTFGSFVQPLCYLCRVGRLPCCSSRP